MRNPDEAHCAWVATRKAGDMVAAQHNAPAWRGEHIHSCIILFIVYTCSLYLSALVKAACTTSEYPTSKQFYIPLKALIPNRNQQSCPQCNQILSSSGAPVPAIPAMLISLRHQKYRTISKEDIYAECHHMKNFSR